MRIIVGLLLLSLGIVWLLAMGPASRLQTLLGSETLVVMFGYVTFFLGAFHLLPRPWTWGEVVTRNKQIMRTVWASISVLSGLGGVGIAITSAGMLRQNQKPLAVLGLFFAAALIGGAASQLRAVWRSRERQFEQQAHIEAATTEETNRVLQLAREHDGRVTAAEVAASSATIGHRRAAEILDGLREEGLCEERVSSSGSTFYEFPSLMGVEHKRDILDPELSFHEELGAADEAAPVTAPAEKKS